MKFLVFKHEELQRILDYNAITGILRWKIKPANHISIGDIAGSKDSDGYIIIRIKGKAYKAHRLAYFHYHGYMPENDLDHRDRIRHHNWILNLREASSQCQNRNKGNPKNNTSGVKGIVWHKVFKKWVAFIYVEYKRKQLGYFTDFDEAVCHRLAAEQCLNWAGCDSSSPAYKYVTNNIQKKEK